MNRSWIHLSRREMAVGLLVALAVGALVCGWQALWFLTDDSYITFRYASNSHFGHGYVWNAPPFPPVEGYTSLLWLVLLDVVWQATGIEPPVAANPLLLGFSALTLVLTAAMVWRLPLRAELGSVRLLLLAWVLLAVVSNRTFLAFASSGLETALFNFLLTAWVSLALFVGREKGWRGPTLHGAAALAALTRPDGLLFAAASGLLWLGEVLVEKANRETGDATRREVRFWRAFPARRAGELAPLSIVPAHLLWRHHTYGEWLPNTYYAKHLQAWPESGLQYLLSFVLEYALWLWLLLAALWMARLLRQSSRSLVLHSAVLAWSRASLPSAVVTSALLAHAGYYVLVIGGDHFEYRVLSQLVPWVAVSAVWLLNALAWRRGPAVAFLLALVVASWPIPWVHWHRSQRLTTRSQTHFMKVPVEDAFPAPLRGYARLFDRTQFWLIDRMVCTRHREHQIFHRYQSEILLHRDLGLTAPADGFPVAAAGSVGVVGWVLPRANILDLLGLNDRVIARGPARPNTRRKMGHDRFPPAGYVECFSPNVRLRYQKARTVPRHPPLTAEDIRACESRDW